MTPINYEEVIEEIEMISRSHCPCIDIGSGGTKTDYYTTVDLYGKPDIIADARQLPFNDNSIGHILANNLLEHFFPQDAQECLAEWKRVLKPGGVLVVMVPSIDVLIDIWTKAEDKSIDLWNSIMARVYAMHDKPGMGHKWGYTLQSLSLAIYGAGFHILKLYQHFPPRPTPNCTVFAGKPLCE